MNAKSVLNDFFNSNGDDSDKCSSDEVSEYLNSNHSHDLSELEEILDEEFVENAAHLNDGSKTGFCFIYFLNYWLCAFSLLLFKIK